MEFDRNNQPEIGIHYKNNIAKHLNELIGICRGIIANEVVNSKEFHYLHAWLKDNENLKRDPDYIDLLDMTTDLSLKPYVDASDFEELLEQINCVLEFRCEANTPFKNSDIAVGRLIGLTRGLLSDGVFDDQEIHFLKTWLKKCDEFQDVWPISEITIDINNVLEDGVITEDERRFLTKKLHGLIGGAFQETGVTSGFSADFFCSDIEYIDFINKEFCLTGQFLYGSRNECKNKLVQMGAVFTPNPRKTTNYLVIGSLSSRDWKQTSHGRKIEKAISLKDSGQDIFLLHEETWSRFLV